MKKEKKKKGRRAYLNDFQKNGAGGYVYKGDLYQYTDGEKQRKKDLLTLMGLVRLAAVIVAIAAGCLPCRGAGAQRFRPAAVPGGSGRTWRRWGGPCAASRREATPCGPMCTRQRC